MIVHTGPYDRSGLRIPHVLIYVQGVWQIQLCRHFFSELKDIQWVVLIEGTSQDVIKLSEEYTASNIIFSNNIIDAYLRIDVFSAVITTFAIPHRAHIKGIQLFSVCSQLGIPFFELQHGMFQIGVNYQEHAGIVGDGFYGAASALPVRNFHDKLLSWSDEDGIGYPGYFNLQRSSDLKYCLILSNMHWNIYGEVDQTLFFESVHAVVRANPKTQFIWKPHPSETSKRTEKYFQPASENAYPNLILMTHEVMMEQGLTTESLIRDCSYAISSISTVLMELEMYKKKVAVFAPSVASGLWTQIKTATKFVYPGELVKIFPKLARKTAPEGLFESGLLKAFEPEKLRYELTKRMPENLPAKTDVARVIAPLLST